MDQMANLHQGEIEKKKRDYTFAERQEHQYVEGVQYGDNEMSELHRDLVNAESVYTGKYARQEYSLIAELRQGPPSELKKEKDKRKWRVKKQEELRKIQAARKDFEVQFGSRSYERNKDLDTRLGKLNDPLISNLDKTEMLGTINAVISGESVEEEGYQVVSPIVWEDILKLGTAKRINGLPKDVRLTYSKVYEILNSVRNNVFKDAGEFAPDRDANIAYNAGIIRRFKSDLKKAGLQPEDLGVHSDRLTEALCLCPELAQTLMMNAAASAFFNITNMLMSDRELNEESAGAFMELNALKNVMNRTADAAVTRLYSDETQNEVESTYREWLQAHSAEQNEEMPGIQENTIGKLKEEKREKEVDDALQGNFAPLSDLKVIGSSLVFHNSKKEIFGDWKISGKYMDYAKAYLTARFGEKIDPTNREFRAVLTSMNNNLVNNLHLIRESLNEDRKEATEAAGAEADALNDIHFGNKTLIDKMTEILTSRDDIKDHIFEEWTNRNVHQTHKDRIKTAARGLKEQFEVYIRRAASVKQRMEPLLGEEVVRELLSKDTFNIFSAEEMTEEQLNEILIYREGLVDANKNYLKMMVGQNFSTYISESAYETIEKKMLPQLAFATPAVLRVTAEQIISNINLETGDFSVREREQKFRRLCFVHNLPARYYDIVGKKCRGENINTESGVNAITQIVKNACSNDERFREMAENYRLTAQQWDDMIKLRDENICEQNLIDMVMNLRDQANFSLGYQTLTYAAYRLREGTRVMDRPEDYRQGYYAARISKEALSRAVTNTLGFSKEERAILLRGVEALIFDKNSALRRDEAFKFLNDRKVESRESLDRLTEAEYLRLINHIKTNIAGSLDAWRTVKNSPDYDETLKSRILAMLGERTYNEETLRSVADGYKRENTDMEGLARTKLMIDLERSYDETKAISYRFMDVMSNQDYKIKRSRDFKPSERIKRFEYAKKAWSSIGESNRVAVNAIIFDLMQKAKEKAEQKGKGTDKRLDYINDRYREIRDYARKNIWKYDANDPDQEQQLRDAKASFARKYPGIDPDVLRIMDDAFQTIRHDKNSEETGRDKYFLEFMLSGHENYLYSHHGDYSSDAGSNSSFGEKSRSESDFLLYEDKDYIARTFERTELVMNRHHRLETELKEHEFRLRDNTARLSEEQIKGLSTKLRRYIALLEEPVGSPEEIEKIKSANLKKYGFDSFDSLLAEIKANTLNYIADAANNGERLTLQRRMQEFETYDNGIFAPVKDILLQNDKFISNMSKKSNEEFLPYLEQLKRSMQTPLELFRSSHGMNQAVIRQFVMSNEREILSNSYDNKKEWEKQLNKFSDRLFDTRIGDRNSINERIRRLAKGNFFNGLLASDKEILYNTTNIMAKINLIIDANADDFGMLLQTETLEKGISRIAERIRLNSEKLDRYEKLNLNEQKIKTNPEDRKILAEWKKEKQEYFKRLLYTTEPDRFTQERYNDEYCQFFNRFFEKRESITEISEESRQKNELIKSVREGYRSLLADSENCDMDYRQRIEELKEKTYRTVSPVMAKYGKAGQKDVDKARDDIDTLISETGEKNKRRFSFDRHVLELFSERQAGKEGKIKDKDQLFRAIEAFDLLYRHYMEKSGEKQAQKYLVYLFCNADIRDVIDNNYRAITGKVQEIDDREAFIKELTEAGEAYHLGLKPEFDELMRVLPMAVYTLGQADFTSLVADRKKYFDVASKAYFEIDRMVQDNVGAEKAWGALNNRTVSQLKLGCRQLIHGELVKHSKDQNADDASFNRIISGLKNMVDISELRSYFLVSNMSGTYGSVSYEDLTEKEIGGRQSVETRQTMNELVLSKKKGVLDYLLFHGNHEIVKKYNNLTLEQRKLFAAVLSMPYGMMKDEELPSVSMIYDETELQNQRMEISEQIGRFIKDGEFDAVIDYDRALSRIRKEDGTANAKVFINAYNLVISITNARKAGGSKDYNRLDNGLESLKLEGSRKLQEHRERLEKITNLSTASDFAAELEKLAEEDEGVHDDWAIRLENFREQQGISSLMGRFREVAANKKDLNLLVLILQNRSMLDYSTGAQPDYADAFHDVDIANFGLRELFKDSFSDYDNPDISAVIEEKVNEKGYRKAMETLFSYQLRDDAELGAKLKESDYSSDSLHRNTMVDWTLLTRAFRLLDEIKAENNRIKGVRLAREHVLDSGNEKANEEYIRRGLDNNAVKLDMDAFDTMVSDNSTTEEEEKDTAEILMSYKALSQTEKVLFIKALQHRDILDISRKNMVASFFGQANRDYVNARGRDELMNSFIAESLGEETSMKVTETEITNAAKTLLSSQIDDTRDFSDIETIKKLTVGGRFYEVFQSRSTAVDWDLFRKALQFVHRTMEERELVTEEMELYRSQGDLREEGRYKFAASDFLRRNLVQSGYRVNRVFARKGLEALRRQVPDMAVSVANLIGNHILPRHWSAKIGELDSVHFHGMGGIRLSAGTGVLWEIRKEILAKNGKLGLMLRKVNNANKTTKKFDFEITKQPIVKDVYAYASNTNKVVKQIFNVVDMGTRILSDKEGKLNREYHYAKDYVEEDQRHAEEARSGQTLSQQKLSDDIIKKNRYIIGKTAKALTDNSLDQQLTEDMIVFFDTLISGGMFTFLPAEMKLKPGIKWFSEIVNAAKVATITIMQAVKDKNMLNSFYQEGGPFHEELSKYDAGHDGLTQKQQEKVDKLKKSDPSVFARRMHGFEGFEEQSGFVCRRIVHSILFSASAQNPNMETRMKSAAILMVMDMKDDIGKIDSATHEKLYSKFMNKEYT